MHDERTEIDVLDVVFDARQAHGERGGERLAVELVNAGGDVREVGESVRSDQAATKLAPLHCEEVGHGARLSSELRWHWVRDDLSLEITEKTVDEQFAAELSVDDRQGVNQI